MSRWTLFKMEEVSVFLTLYLSVRVIFRRGRYRTVRESMFMTSEHWELSVLEAARARQLSFRPRGDQRSIITDQ